MIKLTNGGPEKILASLREHSKNDEKVSKFLVKIFNDELIGIHFWKKTYENTLNRAINNNIKRKRGQK